MDSERITLGDHTDIPVVAQRHARIAHGFKAFAGNLQQLAGQEFDGDMAVELFGDKAYEVLCLLIPELDRRIPEHEFRGYPNRAAMETGAYDPDRDRSPTTAEIADAFETAFRVSRFDMVEKLLGPTMLRTVIGTALMAILSTLSESSPPQSGESDPTSSGLTNPTSTVSEDSPSDDSKDSPPLMAVAGAANSAN